MSKPARSKGLTVEMLLAGVESLAFGIAEELVDPEPAELYAFAIVLEENGCRAAAKRVRRWAAAGERWPAEARRPGAEGPTS